MLARLQGCLEGFPFSASRLPAGAEETCRRSYYTGSRTSCLATAVNHESAIDVADAAILQLTPDTRSAVNVKWYAPKTRTRVLGTEPRAPGYVRDTGPASSSKTTDAGSAGLVSSRITVSKEQLAKQLAKEAVAIGDLDPDAVPQGLLLSWLEQEYGATQHWQVPALLFYKLGDRLSLPELRWVLSKLAARRGGGGSGTDEPPGEAAPAQAQLSWRPLQRDLLASLGQLLERQQLQEAGPGGASDSDKCTGTSDGAFELGRSLHATCLNILASTAQLGIHDQGVTGQVLQHVQLADCSCNELADVAAACAQLGHAVRKGWLLQLMAVAEADLSNAHGSAVARLLWALSKYKVQLAAEPHRQAAYLGKLQAQAGELAPADINKGLTAIADLGLQPSESAVRALLQQSRRLLYRDVQRAGVVRLVDRPSAALWPGETANDNDYAQPARNTEHESTSSDLPDRDMSRSEPPSGLQTGNSRSVAAGGSTSGGSSSDSERIGAAASAAWDSSGLADHSDDDLLQLPNCIAKLGFAPNVAWSTEYLRLLQHRLPQLSNDQLLTVMESMEAAGIAPPPAWCQKALAHFVGGKRTLSGGIRMFSTLAGLLRDQSAVAEFVRGSLPLLEKLATFLSRKFKGATPAELMQVVAGCAKLGFYPGRRFMAWHEVACNKHGKQFPAEDLRIVRMAYTKLGVLLERQIPTARHRTRNKPLYRKAFASNARKPA